MLKFQAQLALYGAIDQAVVASEDPAIAGIVEKFLPGTTGFGQRGWYRDAELFLDELADGSRVTLLDLDAAREILFGEAGSGTGLPAAVTARAILAEVILENIDRARGGGTHLGSLGPLAQILSVAPTPARSGDSEDTGTVGDDLGGKLAERLQTEVSDLRGFRAFMNAQSNRTISAAVASYDPKAFLRKVRGEYCSVITTDARWTDVSFDELLAIADPQNWDDFFREFFCAMTLQGETAQGWDAVLEEVSGDCGQYSLTTPLRFWKQFGDDDLFMNYDLDEGNASAVDHLVLVDNGYIWITREDAGSVRVRTSKELLIRGLSSTATTALAGGLGWADNVSGMFRHGAKHPPAKPVPYQNSIPKAAAKAPQSSPFPIDPPVLPPDIRLEGVDDTIDELKGTIASLAGLGTEFAARWSNGIDEEDIRFLGARLGVILGERSASFLDTASSNFRPAPIPKSTV